MSNTLKLLDDLEKLNGLPLEREGQEIKNSLKESISDEMKKKVEGIINPYIMIKGNRDEAIKLAAYIYLEKSTVYSDVYLHEEHNKAAVSLLRKAKKGESIYLALFHTRKTKFSIGDRNKLTGKRTLTHKLMDPVPITYCKYVNKKTGRYDKWSFCIDYYQHGLVRDDFYYKGNRHRPAIVKGEPIEIIYQNEFRYVDRKKSRPEILNTLKIIDEGNTSMTYCDMLKFKNTVFLLDFMKGIKDEDIDCDALLEFSNELHELRKSMPGSLIIHIDKTKKWPKYFLEQLEVIPAGKTKTVREKIGAEQKNLKRGGKQNKVPYEKLIPYVKKNLSYLRSPEGGSLKGGALQERMQKDVKKQFEKKYEKGTMRNLISDINTGKK